MIKYSNDLPDRSTLSDNVYESGVGQETSTIGKKTS